MSDPAAAPRLGPLRQGAGGGHPPFLLVGGLCATVIAVVALLVATSPGTDLPDVVVPVATAVVFCGAGLMAWQRRPHNDSGQLMIWAGLSFPVAALSATKLPVLGVVGMLAQTLPLAATLHTLMAFPSGRLPDRASRLVTAAGYVVALGLQVPVAVLDPPPVGPGTQSGAGAAIAAVQAVAGLAVLARAVVVLDRRAGRAGPATRQAMGPLVWYGPVALAVAGASALLADLVPDAGSWTGVVQTLALLGLPIAFLVGLLSGGYGRAGEVGEALGSADAAAMDPEALRRTLASALGDSGLTLAFRREDRTGFVTADGDDVRLSSLSPRMVVPVTWQGSTMGALAYDADLVGDTELVDSLATLAGLLVAHQRLAAQLRAQLGDLDTAAANLRAAQRRIVTAGDAERRRIARDLHDGAQQRVVALGLRAIRLARSAGPTGTGREAEELAVGLYELTEELRSFVAGVMPPELDLRGLPDAVRSLASLAPVPVDVTAAGLPDRLPGPVETTAYFVVAEALANAGKHAAANHIAVSLRHTGRVLHVEVADDGTGDADVAAGTGLRGLADRVAAIGGTMTVTGSAGHGSTIAAELPCDP